MKKAPRRVLAEGKYLRMVTENGWEFAELFRGKTEDELEELAASFALKNCKTRDRLNEYLREDMELTRAQLAE